MLEPHTMNQYYFTVKEAADHLGVSTKTVYTYIHEGRLEAYRYGPRSYRISLDAFDALYRPYVPAGRR
jgi:excisionase family DNA binding protein